MPNRQAIIQNPYLPITGIVGTYLGGSATCIPLTLLHLADEEGNGYTELVTDGINILDYTDYSFMTLSTALDDLNSYTIQPQVSLNNIHFFDSLPAITSENIEMGSELEQSFHPSFFGNYARLKISADAKFPSIHLQDDLNRLANTYILFHGRHH